MLNEFVERAILAYFSGGNAQGKSAWEIGQIFQVIIEIVEKGKYEPRQSQPNVSFEE